MKKKINKYCILLFVFITNMSCHKINSNPGNIYDGFEIKVYSPYNCYYSFVMKQSKLTISSEKIVFDLNSEMPLPIDTSIIKYDMLVPFEVSKKIEEILSVINKNEVTSATIEHGDAFYFQLYLNNRLIKSQSEFDNELYGVLKEIRPYVQNHFIECDDFFVYLDEIISNND